jgi:hypothetical protein
MPLRYYPSFSVKTNLVSSPQEFALNGVPYSGKYYLAQNGQAFSGPDPETGPSEPLTKIPTTAFIPGLAKVNLPDSEKKKLAEKTAVQFDRIPGKPNSFYPQPTEADYRRGYLIRYFTKKENERGYITEISEADYSDIVNGTADYDISIYQTTKILWKITGPLRSQRQSQYNTIPGIIDTNQRLTEAANKTFLGIVEYIGGDYTKYARPTA